MVENLCTIRIPVFSLPVEPGDKVYVPDLEPRGLGQQHGQADAVSVELESAHPGRGGDELGQPGDR